jgi:hypothetical protein
VRNSCRRDFATPETSDSRPLDLAGPLATGGGSGDVTDDNVFDMVIVGQFSGTPTCVVVVCVCARACMCVSTCAHASVHTYVLVR